jgi:hypothetical protein
LLRGFLIELNQTISSLDKRISLIQTETVALTDTNTAVNFYFDVSGDVGYSPMFIIIGNNIFAVNVSWVDTTDSLSSTPVSSNVILTGNSTIVSRVKLNSSTVSGSTKHTHRLKVMTQTTSVRITIINLRYGACNITSISQLTS